jgi:hypothetical protein
MEVGMKRCKCNLAKTREKLGRNIRKDATHCIVNGFLNKAFSLFTPVPYGE